MSFNRISGRQWSATLAAAVLAFGLAAPATAGAQERGFWSGMGRMMWGDGPGMSGRWGRGPMMGLDEDAMLDRIEGRLAFMKAELKITDAQAGQWDELASAVRSTAEIRNAMMRSMREEIASGEFDKKSLPDRLVLQETHLEARLEQVRTLKTAVDALYGVLTDEQKEAADEIVLPVMGMGMGRRPGMGRMRQ